MGFASGSITKEGITNIRVPDVHLTVSIDTEIIMSRLQGLSKGRCPTHMIDKRKVQKTAICAFTDYLQRNGGLKFRCSAFRCLEPKVTMMAPSSLGISECSIPLDFTVNSLLPLCNATLLTECGQIDRRAKALIILVRRWAKDRGICHAAKGHLPPYAWTLLAIYFLQVREGGAILPPLEGFKVASKLRKDLGKGDPAKDTSAAAWQPPRGEAAERPVSALFKDFVRFYNTGIVWRNEAVSVRLGARAPADIALPLQIVIDEHGSSNVAPSVEDPFDITRNLR